MASLAAAIVSWVAVHAFGTDGLDAVLAAVVCGAVLELVVVRGAVLPGEVNAPFAAGAWLPPPRRNTA